MQIENHTNNGLIRALGGHWGKGEKLTLLLLSNASTYICILKEIIHLGLIRKSFFDYKLHGNSRT